MNGHVPSGTRTAWSRRELLLAGVAVTSVRAAAPPACKSTWLSDEETERFLSGAKILKSKYMKVGIAGTMRCTLSDGSRTHEAHFSDVDVTKPVYQSAMGTEFNFRDSWKFNCAAYRLDRILGLKMIPVSVPRRHKGNSGSMTWWVDCARMDLDRYKAKEQAPNQDDWARQTHVVRVFDQLIYNTDRNLQNLLITPDWRIWMIDHTRAFRRMPDLMTGKPLDRCERKLFSRLQTLSVDEIRPSCEDWLDSMQISGLMERRDKIVELFQKRIAERGESAVLYDYDRNQA